MMLYELLSVNFKMTEAQKASVMQISDFVGEDCYFGNPYIINKTVSRFGEESSNQKHSASAAQIEVYGFDELMNELGAYPPSEIISMRSVDSKAWGGQAFCSCEDVFLGVMLARKRRVGWKTPPHWDGSEEMLVSYNLKDQRE